MIFWARYWKINMKNSWKYYLENRYKWKALIVKKFSNWTQKESRRTFGGITVSLIVHSIAILLFLGMEQLERPSEPPIREISFLDLTEEPVESKPKKQRVQNKSPNQLIMETNKKRVGFVVDNVVGSQQAVIKKMGNAFRNAPDISGATILGNGSVALIVDVNKIMDLRL